MGSGRGRKTLYSSKFTESVNKSLYYCLISKPWLRKMITKH
jgi:hypothetical protein